VRGVSKTYQDVEALKNMSLEFPRGELTSLLGPSGCGKTTLLRCIAGFERPDAGTIRLSGQVVSGPGVDTPPERRRVGIVPQEGALFPHLDVAGNVAFGLRGLGRSSAAARVDELLELVGLPGLGRRRPDQLSGGQQQRVALARALAPKPSVVLLDEPFAALDASLRSSVRSEVASVLRSTRTTAMLVTHDQDEALEMADEVAVMRDGTIIQSAPPAELYRRPVDVATARFVGDVVVLPGEMRDGLVECSLGTLVAVASAGSGAVPVGRVTALVRPEQIVRDDASVRRASVVSLAYHGHDALVGLRHESSTFLARWSGVDLPRPGDEVGVRVSGPVVVLPGDPPAG
jgi:iron(III) transport system ATP-binding protein